MIKYIKRKYKICFQTRSKVLIYKNSRLRFFYRLRNTNVLMQGIKARNFIIMNNMRWRVLKRSMVPYNRPRTSFRYYYKNIFFTKQQLKHFYGSLNEYKLRNIFKKTWNHQMQFRKNVFMGALEQRLNVILFRMRLFPTIFSSGQYVLHRGALVNNVIVKLPSERIKLCSVVSVIDEHWSLFYDYILDRAIVRTAGYMINCLRKYHFMKKFCKRILRNRDFFSYAFILTNFFTDCATKCNELSAKIDSIEFLLKNKKFKKLFKFLKTYLIKYVYKYLLDFLPKLHYLDDWIKNRLFYYQKIHYLFFKLMFIKNMLRKIKHYLYLVILNNIKKNFKKSNNKKVIMFLKKHDKILPTTIFEEKYSSYIVNYQKKKEVSFFTDELTDDEFFYNNNIFYNPDKEDRENTIIIQKLEENNKFNVVDGISTNFFDPTLKKLAILTKNADWEFEQQRFVYKVRQVKYRLSRKKLFKSFCFKTQWFVPSYLEIDYKTLRCFLVRYPYDNEVFYGFPVSFKKLIAFYKERAL